TPVATPAARVYDVELGSTPGQAVLVADDNPEFSCKTPCRLSLKPGRHTLKAALPGYREALKIIQVPPDLDVQIPMQALFGRVFAESTPPGATVVVDGSPIPGVTPTSFTLPPGPHKIEIRNATHASQSTIEVRDGAIHRLSATLE